MKDRRPDVIKARHLARKAIVYVRQSSEEQVLSNQGSTEAQRSQAELAERWGWRKKEIEIIDVDLGLSGTATAHRTGYQHMVEDIQADRVGIIFLTDHTRAGRTSIDWFHLLNHLEHNDVLLAIDGTAYDSKDAATILMSKIYAVFGEHENRARRAHMERGRMAKIAAGKTVTQPPVGYIRLPDGSWIRDPDPVVQQGVEAVFRAFLKARSLRAAVRCLQADGLRIPRRRTGHPVGWVPPSVPGVQRIVTNQNFTGDYVWGRNRSDPRHGRDRRGRLRARRVEPGRRTIISNHHEPYVTRADWEEVQSVLVGNRWNGRHPGGLGRGRALLQGLIRCRRHRGWRMAPAYKNERKDGTSPHSYHCIGDYHDGGLQCGHRPGRPIDDAVVEAVLLRLEPPKLAVLRDLWRQSRREAVAEGRQLGDELRGAQREAEDLWERFMSVDSESRLVRAALEHRLEEAEARVRMLRERGTMSPSRTAVFDEQGFEELLGLAQTLPALWSAETTTDLDRKEILRALIADVYVEAVDRERIDLTVLWSDGAVETQRQVILSPRAHRLIREWAAEGLSETAIAVRLGDLGIRTKYGTEWSAKAVHRALARMTERESTSVV
ncbi:MAG: recombinase family protein [Candidatus Binatia bacterium]